MLLNPGSFVTISHYSLTSVFRSTVLAANGNNVEVKLPKECMRSNFLVGDPLAVAYEVRNLAKIKGARVSHYNAEEAVLIFVEDTYEEEVKMRSYVHSHIKDYIKKSEIELISCFSRV